MTSLRIWQLSTFVTLVLVIAAGDVQAQTFFVLYDFGSNSDDPSKPAYSGIIAQGRDGNLYSTAPDGGTCCGAVFQITPAGTLKNIHNFTGSKWSCGNGGYNHGSQPESGEESYVWRSSRDQFQHHFRHASGRNSTYWRKDRQDHDYDSGRHRHKPGSIHGHAVAYGRAGALSHPTKAGALPFSRSLREGGGSYLGSRRRSVQRDSTSTAYPFPPASHSGPICRKLVVRRKRS